MIPPAKTPMGEKLRLHGSDKAWPHCFDVFYSEIFPDRHAPLDILEIGLADGWSLRGWRDWFTRANLMGFDVEPCERLSGPRIVAHRVEQTDVVGMWNFIGERRFDWIIDDASHLWTKQVLTLVMLWPALKPGGWYCVEDVADYQTGGFDFVAGLGCFRGEYHDLSDKDYPDGGHLFALRKPTWA